MEQFKGTGVALVTPFRADKSVDFDALTALVELQIAGKTNFLVVQGTTGETATLTEQEKEDVLQCVIKVNAGRLPIVLGVGGNNTLAILEELKTRNFTGVDGILSVSPYYNKPSQEGIFQHFKAIDSATPLPVIAYNVPGRTGSNMTAETTLRIADLPNIIAIKEASGNLEQVMQIIENAPKDFLILSGDDALTLPMIAAGAHGVISVVANALPEIFNTMVHASLAGDFVVARKNHYDLLGITQDFFAEGNPAGVKAALKARGIAGDVLRLPLVNISAGLNERIVERTNALSKKYMQ